MGRTARQIALRKELVRGSVPGAANKRKGNRGTPRISEAVDCPRQAHDIRSSESVPALEMAVNESAEL